MGKPTEDIYFLAAGDDKQYHLFYYTYNGSSWSEKDGPNIQKLGFACNICNFDTGNDSLIVKLKSVKQTWCDPKPLYVLEAAPYFKELSDQSCGSTWVTNSTSTGSETSTSLTLSTSVEFSFNQDLECFVKFGEVEAGNTLSMSLSYDAAVSKERSVSCNYVEGNGQNNVIVARSPAYIYTYEVYGSDKPFAVQSNGTPEIAGISIEGYNALAEDYNLGCSPKEKLPIIDSKFGLGEPGNPYSYRNAFPKEYDISPSLDQSTTSYYSDTATEKEITDSTTVSQGFSIELGYENFSKVNILGAAVQISVGTSAEVGYSVFNTKSLTRGGCAGNQYVDDRFNFKWDVGFWSVDGVPVVGYKVVNVKGPTMTPEDFKVEKDSISNHSATLTWTTPTYYKQPYCSVIKDRTLPKYVRIYQKQNNHEYDESNYIEVPYNYDPENPDASDFYRVDGAYNLTGLERNKTYTFRIVGYDEAGESNKSRPSEEVIFTTGNVHEVFNITVTAGKGVTLRSGSGAESQSTETAIDEISYSIKKGYKLPANAHLESKNGITIQTSSNIITISGTPTASYDIVIPDMQPISYSIKYNLDGGELTNPVKSYTIESKTITLPTPTKQGYKFTGWTDASGKAVTKIAAGSTGNKTFTANWEADSNIPYTVEYYLMDTNGNWLSSPSDTETLHGTAGEQVTVTPKTRTGFSNPAPQDITIKADGTSKVKFYCERKKFTLTLKDTAGACIDTVQGTYYYGETIRLSATVANGYVFTGWATSSTATPFATQNPYDFTMPASSKTIWALSAQSTELQNTSTLSAASIALGDTVTVKGSATGGTAPYRYNVLYKQNSQTSWTTAQAYQENATVTFKPSKAADYDVCIKVKDSAGKEVKQYFTVTVSNHTELSNNSTLSATEIVLGSTITATGKASGGEGGYTYSVLCKKKADTKWVTKQNFSTNDTVSIKPAYAVDYDVCIKVKDSAGTIVKKYFEVKVNEKLSNLSTLASENITLGEKVTVNGLAQGGMGEYQYQVLYKQTSQTKWTTAQDFNKNATVTFKPGKAKAYDVCVKVKDATGKISKVYFTVTVSDNQLISTSTISATTIKKGESVTLNGSATGGAGNYTYSVSYKQKSQSKWTMKQDFSENSVISVQPSQVTDYDICIKVQDKAGTVAKQYFTVTVTK